MGGFLSRINTRLHNVLSRSGTIREAPVPSDASTVSRVTNRRARGRGPLPPPLPRRPPPLPVRSPRQDGSAHDAAGIASLTGREAAIRALEIVAERAALTSDDLDHRADTTAAQLERDVNAFNTHPPHVAHVAALTARRTAAGRLVAAAHTFDAAQARANAHVAGLAGRVMAATRGAEGGHPEQLQQLTQETHAVQAAVNAAQQASMAAPGEYTARDATVQAAAAVHDEWAVAGQALRQRRQDLAQLRGTQQLATDALVDAWTASNAMQKMP